LSCWTSGRSLSFKGLVQNEYTDTAFQKKE
jgi:hypothetical protein